MAVVAAVVAAAVEGLWIQTSHRLFPSLESQW